MKKSEKKFLAWKTNATGMPIEGSDRIMSGKSRRWIIKHIADENNVKIFPGALVVRLKNGDMWFVKKYN